MTMLNQSVLWGHTREFQQLLVIGTNPNLREHGYTPLHLAAMKGRHAFVLLLIGYGADPYATDNLGRTALVIFRKRHAFGFGSVLCLPTLSAHRAHEALCLPPLNMTSSALPSTAFYALRNSEEPSSVVGVGYTDISILSPGGEVHLAMAVVRLRPVNHIEADLLALV